MIKSIHISNYALIDKVEIDLSDGLNIITGETGAGKSIMLGALSLLLGAKSDSKVVTDPEKKSIVEAVIMAEPTEAVSEFFRSNSLDRNNDDSIILRREVAQNGRSRAFINDTPVNVSQLETLAKQLIDIHSQHQNLLLANPEFQLRVIDSIASDSELLEEYREKYNAYRSALRSYSHLKKRLEGVRGNEDALSEELEKIDNLRLRSDEQEELEAERKQLSNYTGLKESLAVIIGNLDGEENSVIERVRECSREAEDIQHLIADGSSLSERLNSVLIELQDIAETFEDIDSDLTADPDRLEYIQTRLNSIYRLQKKYNVESVDGLIEVADKIRADLSSIDAGESRLLELQKHAKSSRMQVLDCARRLSLVRRNAAKEFMEELQEKAAPLGMKNIKAQADFTYSQELTPDGIDIIEFKFAFNKNQEPLPISKTASGGEISRLMLCIKNILADRMQLPTIVFDEVDTGVSGEIANRMGEMMLAISSEIQVIAITHLPQVASKGETHFKVYKEDDELRTNTRLVCLDEDSRVRELALMLSGSAVDDAALANARSLLKQNKS